MKHLKIISKNPLIFADSQEDLNFWLTLFEGVAIILGTLATILPSLSGSGSFYKIHDKISY